MQSFMAEYQKLNDEQRAAVDYIDGPLMVVAGPGTGKTQLLALRAANILRQTDTSADNILCLTYTNKAALNMRERLNQLVGSEARGITVKTFHGFAAEIMNRYSEHFWNGARLTNVPETMQLEIISDVLSTLPLDHPLALKFSGQYTMVSDALDAIRLCKEAGLTPDKLRAIIGLNLAYLDTIEPQLVELLSPRISAKQIAIISTKLYELPPLEISSSLAPLQDLRQIIIASFDIALQDYEATGKSTAISAWKKRLITTVDKQPGLHSERQRNNWWLSVAEVYEKYNAELNANGYYDYSDMVIEVISKLETTPELLATVQEQYSYVLVDEYQDTNAAQARLTHLVADHHTSEGRPNLMIVGDDDQSIFKFQGAELNNMLNFKQSYPAVKVIVLEQNYRSTQSLIDVSAKIINQAKYRLVTLDKTISKNLVAAANTQSSQITHRQYAAREQQYNDIAELASKVWRDNQSVAILARDHSSLRQIAEQLRQRQTAIRYEKQTNILELESVVQLQLICSLIVAINDGDMNTANAYLRQSLMHPMWGIAPRDLWQLAILNRRGQDWLDSLLEHDDEQLQNIAHWLLNLALQTEQTNLRYLLEIIIGLRGGEQMTSPILNYFTKCFTPAKSSEITDRISVKNNVSRDDLENLSAINQLLNMACETSGEKAKLHDFVSLIDITKDNNKIISDESAYVSGDRAVELLTVHKAKGLEFDTVFIVDAVDNKWQPTSRGRKPPLNLPLRAHGDDFDDYARLMYVAATRAKNHLYVASYRFDDKGAELLATPLITNAISDTEQIELDHQQSAAALVTALSWPRLALDDEKTLLSGRLSNYSLSATHLINFLDITRGGPQLFFERHILNLPEVTGTAAAYGSALHRALEIAQRLAAKFDIGRVESSYEEALKQQPLNEDEFERYLVHGQMILRRLFTDYNYQLPIDGMAELAINDIEIDDLRLNGKLDLVFIEDKRLHIRDYKSGHPVATLTSRAEDAGIGAWRHRTQLIFYNYLLKNSPSYRQHEVAECSMVYIEAENKNQLIKSHLASPEELEQIEKLAKAIWRRIMKLDFSLPRDYKPSYSGVLQFIDDLINE